GATAADFTLDLWFNTEEGFDVLCFGASKNGEEFGALCGTGNSEGWLTDAVVDFSDVPKMGTFLGQPNVWIALIFISDPINTLPEGAYVDNLLLRKCVSPSCLATTTHPARPGTEGIFLRPRQITKP
ncbi:MAG: hypothetical protein ACRDIB_20430, partial [Ardenticatenaceae bacterium]